jgi:hypothetical protein
MPKAPKPTIAVCLAIRAMKVIGLFLGQGGQADAELAEMEAGDLFIELFGEDINFIFVAFRVAEDLDLGDDLITEAV